MRVTWHRDVFERAVTKLLTLRDAVEAEDQQAASDAFGTDELAVMATIDALRVVLSEDAPSSLADYAAERTTWAESSAVPGQEPDRQEPL